MKHIINNILYSRVVVQWPLEHKWSIVYNGQHWTSRWQQEQINV